MQQLFLIILGIPLPYLGLKTAFPQIEQVAPIYTSHNDQLQVLDVNGTPVKRILKEPGDCILYRAFIL